MALAKASGTCSIGFSSGDLDSRTFRQIPSSSRKSVTRLALRKIPLRPDSGDHSESFQLFLCRSQQATQPGESNTLLVDPPAEGFREAADLYLLGVDYRSFNQEATTD
ncbi:hypothetical protein TNCV_2184941 [Trichonephila clavipes]|nr:hypothetical protein TNCV_2184941 [Trichonephila clavipes]